MTIGENRYSGAGASLSIHNPPVTGTQSSASRIRIQNGLDSIQAGWRVDKLLHGGSNQTRLFIHTKAGGINCFNTLCPGFVVVRPNLPLGSILLTISKPGGPVYAINIYINRDEHGNWNLRIGNGHVLVGYWPARLFTGLASVLEWGGETYSPAGTPFPPMGAGVSGHSGLGQDTRYDAFFCNVSSFNEGGQRTDAENIVPVVSDSFKYQLWDQGVVDKDNFKHLVFYGGGGVKGNF